MKKELFEKNNLVYHIFKIWEKYRDNQFHYNLTIEELDKEISELKEKLESNRIKIISLEKELNNNNSLFLVRLNKKIMKLLKQA
jgi:5-bromo-4-chloroindolyl phosphate hydrolysis protein